MTPEEIKALIKAKIAGQGSAVDVGSALPAILEGIVDLASSGSPVAPTPALDLPLVELDAETLEDAADILGISVESVSEIPNQLVINFEDGLTGATYTLTRIEVYQKLNTLTVRFGLISKELDEGHEVKFSFVDGLVSCVFYRV